jgi:hypothetical protein
MQIYAGEKNGLHFVDPILDGLKRYWYQMVNMRKAERCDNL